MEFIPVTTHEGHEGTHTFLKIGQQIAVRSGLDTDRCSVVGLGTMLQAGKTGV
jgi:hypothetical protein